MLLSRAVLPRFSSLLAFALLLCACKEPAEPVTPPRAVVRGEAGVYSVVPTPAQLPYCLVIEVQDTAARSLVADEDGESVECEAGKALGPWKLPAKDDPFRAYVIFSDRKLKGDTVALQVRERIVESPKAPITSMDLRAPGQVTIEILSIRPAELRPAR